MLRGHTGAIESVAFGPDSRRIAASNKDGTVRLWDVATGEEGLCLKSDAGKSYTQIAFNRDGLLATAVYPDGAIQLWDADTGAAVRSK